MSTNDEILAQVERLVTRVKDYAGPPATHVMVPARALPVLEQALDAPNRIRRTRVGRWVLDGRTYRTRRLALASAHDRFMAPLWPILLASGQRFVLTGEIQQMEIKGFITA